MGSSFNPLILAGKLSKLNSSQQSIETLSHWCIFHMNKAKQVVETWARQFHCAPREQRLAFLYLANDILQNSRRKGAEFVAEFWKVLPDSLRDVIENGDEFGRKSAMRLVSIWEERKVFGSRGQLLKEEFLERKIDNSGNLKHAGSKVWSPGNGNRNGHGNALSGNVVDKLVSGYQAVYNSQYNEDAVFNKSRKAISFIEKLDKDSEGDYGLGRINSGTTDELKEQHAILRDCIEQLAADQSSRANLVFLLRDALQDEVQKLDKVRDQLQAAQTYSEQAASIHHRLSGNPIPSANQNPEDFTAGLGSQSASQAPFPDNLEDTKYAAAAMAEKLTASPSSAQMLTLVLSSLASEGVISGENPPEKRPRIGNEYVLQPPFALPSDQNPPPPPPVQMYPVPQYMQTAAMQGEGRTNSYQSYTAESGFNEPVAPVSRQ